jgi:hypothetical protein
MCLRFIEAWKATFMPLEGCAIALFQLKTLIAILLYAIAKG